ncbi:hypothetical protein N7526_011412 [Penicillium atrosanguineum]|nr:hypothetical protein N7526_011412 [Penicillium atrosanguineum]
MLPYARLRWSDPGKAAAASGEDWRLDDSDLFLVRNKIMMPPILTNRLTLVSSMRSSSSEDSGDVVNKVLSSTSSSDPAGCELAVP